MTTLYNFTNPTAKPGLNSGMISTVTDKNIGGTGSVLNIDFLVRAIDGQTIMTASANVENDFGSSGRQHACAQWEHDQWSRVAAQLQRGQPARAHEPRHTCGSAASVAGGLRGVA
ncbi:MULTISPECIES: hypothetical protein [unclassified Curtobacterium]|uniref:hypothetical protein n=1 Tax=unclassified Curtobacterium TaxID=257496 RepID=UPI000DA8BEFB|nr:MULTISPECIES: hypothetical protein [unclassified Curtobacterium]PZF37744.1 hypothetical protein DEJ07_14880 [Curtobacterium sp. MCLR17_053]PZF48178.1 hypothetical protein DEJ06_13375 [Curtobacterium sp. MCLR17_051]